MTTGRTYCATLPATPRDCRTPARGERLYRSILSGTEELQAQLVAEMKGRMQLDDTYPALPHGPFFYQTSYSAGAEYPVYKRYPATAPQAEQVLLDVNEAARGHDYYAVASATHSPDHTLFAHAEDTQGSEIYRIRIRHLDDPATTIPGVDNCSGAFVFSPDSRFLFWVWRDEHGRPARVYRRRIGEKTDTLVYEEPDAGFFAGVEATRSGGWIIISSGNHDTSESWLIPGHDPQAAPVCAAPRRDGLMYGLYHQGQHFIILTNADGAYDFKLMVTADTAPGQENWCDLVPHEPGRYITDCTVWSGHVAWRERRDANTRIIMRDLAGNTRALEPAEAAYDLSLSGGYEYDTTALRYVYQSPTTPRQWHAHDMVTGADKMLKQQEVPSGHDPAQYRCWRLMAAAPMASRCRSRCWAVTIPRPMGPPRCFFTAMAPMAMPLTRYFPPACSAWWTEGGSTPSPMCAAGLKRDGTGSLADAGATNPIPSRISLPVPRP